MVKNLPARQETPVWSLGQKCPLEKEMATHSSILAWRIPRTEEPGELQSLGSQSQTRLSDWPNPSALPEDSYRMDELETRFCPCSFSFPRWLWPGLPTPKQSHHSIAMLLAEHLDPLWVHSFKLPSGHMGTETKPGRITCTQPEERWKNPGVEEKENRNLSHT